MRNLELSNSIRAAESPSAWRLGRRFEACVIAAWAVIWVSCLSSTARDWEWLQRIALLLEASIFALSCIGAGSQFVNRLRVRFNPLERLGVSAAAGLAAITTALTWLAAAQLFRVSVLAALSFVLSLYWAPRGWVEVGQLQALRRVRWYTRRPQRAVAAALTLLVILSTLAWAAGPVWDWDSEMYHLPASEFLLDSGGLSACYDNPLKCVPGQAYVVFALGLAAGQPSFAALSMWCCAIATSVLTAGLASRWIGVRAALWAPLIYWSGVIVLTVASSARVEPAYSLYLLAAAALLWSVRCDEDYSWRRGAAAALLLGAAAATKYHAIVGCLALLCAALTWVAFRSRRRLAALTFASVVISAALVLTAPWWIKNWSAFGNPAYPVFAQETGAIGQPGFSMRSSVEPARSLQTLVGVFRQPNRYVGPPNQFPHYAFWAAPVLLLAPRLRRYWPLLFFGVALYLITLNFFPYNRYAFPAFAFLAIATAGVYAHFDRPGVMRLLLPGALVALLAFAIGQPARVQHLPQLARYLFGVSGDQDFLRRISPDFRSAVDWLNRESPADARVLFCFDAREFSLRRRTIIDPQMNIWFELNRGDSAATAARRLLRRAGVSYVVVNENKFQYECQRRPYQAARLADYHRQRRELVENGVLRVVYQSGGVTVLEFDG
ncbi:MAG: hypothetical protein QGG36_08845 [Pirellulaceae bacterium]|nr:hypothetical protein [Pirellulaceae bacterium]